MRVRKKRESMKNRPNKWLAAVLGFVMPPLGMLYVVRWKWAIASGLGLLVLACVELLSLHRVEGLTTLLSLGFAVFMCRVAYVQANRFDPERTRPAYSQWSGILLSSVALIVCVVTFRSFFYEPFRAAAGSMQPTIPVGARMVVQKWGFGNYGTYGLSFFHFGVTEPVARGDILVFEAPPLRKYQYVKRVVALPGDQVTVQNGKLTVNGRVLVLSPLPDYLDEFSMRYYKRFLENSGAQEYEVVFDEQVRPVPLPTEKFAHMESCRYEADEVTCTVPPDHYYFLGDNRDNSMDSRYLGFVPQDHLVGKVIYVSP